jgi:predicted DNA-binding transcriptional regulator AlpA
MKTTLSTKEAAEKIGIEPSTLRTWRAQQRGPRYFQLNARNVRYAVRDVENYVNERLVVPCGGGIERVHAPR